MLLSCLMSMASKKKHKAEGRNGELGALEYDVTTPLWNQYYQAMRKRIRFPRYYKRALNW